MDVTRSERLLLRIGERFRSRLWATFDGILAIVFLGTGVLSGAPTSFIMCLFCASSAVLHYRARTTWNRAQRQAAEIARVGGEEPGWLLRLDERSRWRHFWGLIVGLLIVFAAGALVLWLLHRGLESYVELLLVVFLMIMAVEVIHLERVARALVRRLNAEIARLGGAQTRA